MEYRSNLCNVTPIRIPTTTYQNVYLGDGFKLMLGHLLFGDAPYKVLAIKAVRAELGTGLKESKDIVDALTPEMLGMKEPIRIPDISLNDLLRHRAL